MADAEIIPLGTRGRPGRGSGTTPSASSRSLAGDQQRPQEPVEEHEPGATADEVAAMPAQASARDEEAAGADQGYHDREDDERDYPVGLTLVEPTPLPLPNSSVVVTEPAKSGSRIPLPDILDAITGAAVEVFGEDWERRLAEFLAFLRRRVTGDYSVDEYGLDPEVTDRLIHAMVRPLAENWFRVEVRGLENIPTEGGALVVSNHSGTLPMDAVVTSYAVRRHSGRFLRPLGADLVFRLPFVGELARRAGATLACNEDAERMLARGELVGVWPEGFKGIGKPYSERYKLQRFGRGGFVSAAVKTGVPIVPCSVVGAEEIYPLVGNIPALARLLGAPYIPITPFFPLLGPLGLVPLPSKWIIEFGEPIRTDSYDAVAAEDPMLIFNVTDQVRETVQQTLYGLLMQRKSVFH